MNSGLHIFAPEDSDVAEAMGAAFEAAWASLCLSGERLSAQQACDARIHLARAILACVRRGERDPVRLSEHALDALAVPSLIEADLAPEL